MTLHPYIRFLATGGFAAAVNLASRALLSKILSFEFAVIIAYGIGMTVAYLLARLLVFAPSGNRMHVELLRFGLVNVVSLVQVWIVSVLLVRWALPAVGFTWNAELVGHAIGVLSPVITSYYGHKHFTFRGKGTRL